MNQLLCNPCRTAPMIGAPLFQQSRVCYGSFPVVRKTKPCKIKQFVSGAQSLSTDAGDVLVNPSKYQNWIKKLFINLFAFYKFTRPHTIIGTALSIVSVSLLAMKGEFITAAAAYALLQALSSALLMNVAIVGINQLFDVEIDKINKPYLPLASGEFSMQIGISIVVMSALSGLAVGLMSGSKALFVTLSVSLVLGIIYSVDIPWLRWKRYPVLAAACILAVRAVIVQWGFYSHMKHALGSAVSTLDSKLLFVVGFMLLFSIVIALFKDIPDEKGDRKMGNLTFTVRAGPRIIFWTCIGMLTTAYVGAISYSLLACNAFVSKLSGALGHLLLAGLLLNNARNVDLASKEDIYSCYMFVWKLFYAEYLIFPFL